MANDGSAAAGGRVQTLPAGVAQCKGILRRSWMTKCVTLKNEAGENVSKGVFHNLNSDLIIDSDNQPLGDDRVVVLIAESFSEHDVPSDSLFQLRSWHIINHIFLNGASLYDHEQMNLFNLASTASRWRSHVGARAYESSRSKGTLIRFQRRRPYLVPNP